MATSASVLTNTIHTTETPPPVDDVCRAGTPGGVATDDFACADVVAVVDVPTVAVGFSGNRSISFRGTCSCGDAAIARPVGLPDAAARAQRPTTTARAAM